VRTQPRAKRCHLWIGTNLIFEDYTGGARAKDLQVKIYGGNNFLDIRTVVINPVEERTWYISIVKKSELSSIVSKTKESS
jgi:hypothetical protein